MSDRSDFLKDVSWREDGCWIWSGRMLNSGYGVSPGGEPAHRTSYHLFWGEIPDGNVLHHACETKECVNPFHLVPITVAAHSRLHFAAITHCPSGHAYTPSSTTIDEKGCRRCVTCQRDRARVYSYNRYHTDDEYRIRKNKRSSVAS